VSAIIGTAGDRPDDSLRAIGRIAGRRADQVSIKITPRYLRGRSVGSLIGVLTAGLRDARLKPADVPVHEHEPAAMRTELSDPARLAARDDGVARLVLIMCHEDRPGVESLLEEAGFLPVDDVAGLADLRR
jgi:hypothetical protein